MLPLKVSCPKCGTRYQIDRSHAGKVFTCKHCRSKIATEATLPTIPPKMEEAPGTTRPKTSWNVGEEILNIYQVKDLLGEGGMGKVFRIYHKKWDVDIAVKSPHPNLMMSEQAVHTFVAEAETWVNLGVHPHIVSCYYVRTIDDIPRVFAECVEGGSLRDWIRSQDEQDECGTDKALLRILDVAIQFAWGLHFAHEKGLIHQDVKPANVMMTPEGIVKVTDFGLANTKGLEQSITTTRPPGTMIASYGGLTPAYCSPEQADIRAKREAGYPSDQLPKLTRRTDIWSWAVSVLEMFTKEVTWAAGQVAAEAFKMYLEESVAENSLRMPNGLVAILHKCFKVNPEERFTSMQEIAIKLKDVYRKIAGEEYFRTEPDAYKLLTDSLNNHAISMLDLGKQQEAKRMFNEALQLNSEHLEANFNLGYLQWQQGEIPGSVFLKQMQKLMSSESGNPEYWRCLAWIHFEQGDEEAVAKIQQSRHRVEDGGFIRALSDRERPSGKLLSTYKARNRIYALDFSPNGHDIVLGSREAALTLLSITDPKKQSQDKILTRFSSSCCFASLFESADGIIPTCYFAPLPDSGSSPTPQCVEFSPDGCYFISGSSDATIRLWKVESKEDEYKRLVKSANPFRKELKRFTGHEGAVNSVAFSPDGDFILSGGDDCTLRIWNMASGKELQRLTGHAAAVTTVCFSSDGRYLLSGSKDRTIKMWEAATGKEQRKFAGHSGAITSVCFAPDGRYLLSSSDDMTIRLWEVASGNELRVFRGHTSPINDVCFSSDGRYALSASGKLVDLRDKELQDNTIRLWEIASGRELRMFTEHNDEVLCACFSPDGHYAISGSGGEESLVHLWGIYYPPRDWGASHPYPMLNRVKEIGKLFTEKKQVKSYLKIAKECIGQGDEQRAHEVLRQAQAIPGYEQNSEIMALITICGIKGNGNRQGIRGGWQYGVLEGHNAIVKSVCYSSDGRFIISGGLDKIIRLWDSESLKQIKSFVGHTVSINSVCFSPDNRFALSGSHDKTIRLWEVESGSEVRQFTGHTECVNSVCFSPDGSYLISGGNDETIRIWNVSSGIELQKLATNTNITSTHFSPDGRYAICGGYRGVQVWDICKGKRVNNFDDRMINSVCFSPDGSYALSANIEKTFNLWKVATWEKISTFSGHHHAVSSVRFLADNCYIVSGSFDKTICIWDIANGKVLRQYSGHKGPVYSVCFSPDGRYVISASADKTIRLWEVDWQWTFNGSRSQCSKK